MFVDVAVCMHIIINLFLFDKWIYFVQVHFVYVSCLVLLRVHDVHMYLRVGECL